MHCQRRRRQHGCRPLMALQPAQGVWAAGMDQPPDRGQVGTEVALEDGLVMGDAVAQVGDAANIRVDGFPDDTGVGARRMAQDSAECRYPQRGIEATCE